MSARRPLPKPITVDHPTEFTSKALDEWAYQRGVALDFIRPGRLRRTRFSKVSTAGCETHASSGPLPVDGPRAGSDRNARYSNYLHSPFLINKGHRAAAELQEVTQVERSS